MNNICRKNIQSLYKFIPVSNCIKLLENHLKKIRITLLVQKKS